MSTPSLTELSNELGVMLEEKNQKYGDAFDRTSDLFKIFYPNGIKQDQYDDALLLVRIFDKMMRIASGNANAFNEDAYKDIAGYAMLGLKKGMKRLEAKRASEKEKLITKPKSGLVEEIDLKLGYDPALEAGKGRW